MDPDISGKLRFHTQRIRIVYARPNEKRFNNGNTIASLSSCFLFTSFSPRHYWLQKLRILIPKSEETTPFLTRRYFIYKMTTLTKSSAKMQTYNEPQRLDHVDITATNVQRNAQREQSQCPKMPQTGFTAVNFCYEGNCGDSSTQCSSQEGPSQSRRNKGPILRVHFRKMSITIELKGLRACLHGGGGPQVGEVTRLGGITRLFI